MLSVLQQWPLVLASAVALIVLEQSGVILGWPSPALSRLQLPTSPIPVTNDEGSWIATIGSLTGLISVVPAAISLHFFGRKLSMLFSVIPIIISWCLVAVATTVTELIVARAITGIGIAFAFVSVPVYLGEISPDELRGTISLCMQVLLNIGTLWIYCIGSYTELWLSSLTSVLPLLFFIICYVWLPESPYFFLEKKRNEDAVKALKTLRNRDNVDEDIKQIELTVVANTKGGKWKEIFTDPGHRRALLICIGTFSCTHYTGNAALLSYAHWIFEKAGNVSPNTMAIIKATLQLITSVGAACVVDNVGKKPLLIISSIGSSLFMACEGIYFYLHDYGYNVDSIWWMPLAAMILFNISQLIGLAPISLAFMGELFHPDVKSIGVCISQAYLFLTVFIVGKLFQVLTDALGTCVPFFIFSAVGILSVLFTIFYVPETKGRSLEEIQYYLKHKTFRETTSM